MVVYYNRYHLGEGGVYGVSRLPAPCTPHFYTSPMPVKMPSKFFQDMNLWPFMTNTKAVKPQIQEEYGYESHRNRAPDRLLSYNRDKG